MTKTLTVSAVALTAAVLAFAGMSSSALAQAPAPGGAPAGARPPQPPIVYATPADVAKLLAESKSERQGTAANAPYKPIVRVPGYRAQLEFRVGTTPPSIHNNNNELIYVMKGTGTVVMGGTLDNAKPVGSNQNGTGITGGQNYPLSEGAFVMVPAGTPHGIGTTDPNGLQIFTMSMPAQGAPGGPVAR
jgi:mannose-6-phosphate isomerase-like protein (cupin superfamily)